MPQIDPLIFGAAVFALVAAAIFVPRMNNRYKGPTASDLYVESLPSRYEARITVPDPRQAAIAVTPPEQLQAPLGAPRAVAPTRQAAPSTPPPSAGLEPLKLPVE